MLEIIYIFSIKFKLIWNQSIKNIKYRKCFNEKSLGYLDLVKNNSILKISKSVYRKIKIFFN